MNLEDDDVLLLKYDSLENNDLQSANYMQDNNYNNSIDSPENGESGGSATHHVFHHIFRQHELDELINKNVGNLHIVSSYYDASSWFVICEKVNMWTI